MYARLLNADLKQHMFLGLMPVMGVSAMDVANELSNFLDKLGITNWKTRLTALGSDGASVNTGCQGGLGAILTKNIRYNLQIHRVAHRLEVSDLDACKTVSHVKTTMKGVRKFYSRSSKRL